MRSIKQTFRAACGGLVVMAFNLTANPAQAQLLNPPLSYDDYLIAFVESSTPVTQLLDALQSYPNRTDDLFAVALDNEIVSRPLSPVDREAVRRAAMERNRSELSNLLTRNGYFSDGQTARIRTEPTEVQTVAPAGNSAVALTAGVLGLAGAASALLLLNNRDDNAANTAATAAEQDQIAANTDADNDGLTVNFDADDNNACNPDPSNASCVAQDNDGDGYFGNYPTTFPNYDPDDNDPCNPSGPGVGCTIHAAPDLNANPRNITVGAQGATRDRAALQTDGEYIGEDIDQISAYVPTNQNIAIGADYAFSQGWTGDGVKIAVFDDQVDSSHTEIANFENGGGTVDCSGNNCPSYFTHGTHVASIAAGAYGNGGMTGVAPDATIYGVTIFNDEGEISLVLDDYRTLVDQAVANDVRIFNNSWGGELQNPFAIFDTVDTWQDAMDEGAVFIWARGNDHSGGPDGSDFATLPRWHDELEDQWVAVVNVVESTPGNGDWQISNADAGTNLGGQTAHADANECGVAMNWCISAPGTLIYGAAQTPDDAMDPNFHDDGGEFYTIQSGSSMATPTVSGAFAVLFQAFPYMETDVLVDLVFSTAEDLGAAGVDSVYGHGLLDLEEALTFQGDVPIIASSGSIQGAGLSAFDSSIQTSAGEVSAAFTEAVDGIVVLDGFNRAYQLNTSLFVEAPETEAEAYTGRTLGHVDLASRTVTGGDSPTLSSHFRSVTSGLFFSAPLGDRSKVTVGGGLDHQYALAASTKFHPNGATAVEVGVIHDRKEGRVPTIQTSGAFSISQASTTGYVRASTHAHLSPNWTIGGSAEAGLTRLHGQTDGSLKTGHSNIVTAAASGTLTRHFGQSSISGRLELPVSLVSGDVTYLVPTGRTLGGGVTQEARTWDLSSLSALRVGIEYDWGGGRAGISTNRDFDDVNGFISLDF